MWASEKQVAEFLDELGLKAWYQYPVFVYDKEGRPRVWSPDFYIPRLNMYIEVCGSEDFKYQYRFRDDVYRNNGFYVIFVQTYKETEQWKSHLIKTIMEIEDFRHSEIKKMINSLVQKK
jgi:hypothetical protein